MSSDLILTAVFLVILSALPSDRLLAAQRVLDVLTPLAIASHTLPTRDPRGEPRRVAIQAKSLGASSVTTVLTGSPTNRAVWDKKFNIFYPKFKGIVRRHDMAALESLITGPKFCIQTEYFLRENGIRVLRSLPNLWSVLAKTTREKPSMPFPGLAQWEIPDRNDKSADKWHIYFALGDDNQFMFIGLRQLD
jgi:hypothetical protein